MRAVGFCLLALGAVITAWAFLMNVGVESTSEMAGFPDRVANNDLMNQRLLLGITGSGVFISGWLALIIDRLTQREQRKAAADVLREQF